MSCDRAAGNCGTSAEDVAAEVLRLHAPLRQGTRRFGFIGIGQARPGISARQAEEQPEAEGFALTLSWSTPDDDGWRVTRRVTTVSLDEKLMSEVHAAAQRSGLSDDEVIEQALRRFLDLEVFDEV